MTAAPYRLTSGRIASRRSSSAVTELTRALPTISRKPGLERLDHRRVDTQRQIA